MFVWYVLFQIVVNALMYAIPSIFNVLLVCLVFWLIFSIAGVQLFGGKFRKCVDADKNKLSTDIVDNKEECLNKTDLGYRWINSDIHFDNVLQGYLALFQVVCCNSSISGFLNHDMCAAW